MGGKRLHNYNIAVGSIIHHTCSYNILDPGPPHVLRQAQVSIVFSRMKSVGVCDVCVYLRTTCQLLL